MENNGYINQFYSYLTLSKLEKFLNIITELDTIIEKRLKNKYIKHPTIRNALKYKKFLKALA